MFKTLFHFLLIPTMETETGLECAQVLFLFVYSFIFCNTVVSSSGAFGTLVGALGMPVRAER